MNARSFFQPPRSRPGGFSLVEVVLAIGIVSFAMLVVIGLFGGVMKSSDENTQRRELAEAVDSLRRTFQTEDFDKAAGWVSGGQTLFYVTYRADDNGAPKTNGATVAAKWMPSTNPDLQSYDAARLGRWVRAKLRVSPSDPRGTNLSAPPIQQRASLWALATLDSIAVPNTNLPVSSGTVEITISLLR